MHLLKNSLKDPLFTEQVTTKVYLDYHQWNFVPIKKTK